MNPLQFWIANFLRANCVFVQIKVGSLPPDALGLGLIRLLRRVLPPHTALIVLLVLPPVSDSVSVSGSSGETLNLYTAMEPLEDASLPDPAVDGVPRLKLIARTCQ